MPRPPTRPRAPRARPASTRTAVAPPRLAWRWVLAGLFLVAWGWRALYLARLAGSPLADSRLADARSYWDWATWLRAHGPLGRNAFFLAPLYPYVLAGLRTLLGDDQGRVLHVQALWGAGAAVLLADAARRLTRPVVGAIVGLAVAFGAMGVFFDGLVLTESLLFALGALLLWTVARTAGRTPRVVDGVAWGALIALMAQGRATHAVLLVPAVVLAWSAARATRGAVLAALLGAFVLVCAPAALRNRAVSGEWIPFTYNAGYNLYVGNHAGASGSFESVTETEDITDPAFRGQDGGAEGDGRAYIRERTGRWLGPGASSAWWGARARAWMAASPGRIAALWARKAVMLWSRHEFPQIENADEFRALAGPLGLPWLGDFLVLGALALGGALLAWRRGGAGRFVALALPLETLALLPFFVTDRYRHGLVPAMLLAAAYALDALLAARRDRAVLRALLPGAALGAALALWPVPHLSPACYAWGLAGDVGERWLEHGRADLALEWFGRAEALDARGEVHWRADAPDSLTRAVLQHQRANALVAAGRDAEALQAHARAAALAPGSRTLREALAAALAAGGDTTRATRVYAGLGHAHAGADAASARGWAAARAGDFAGAERAFAEAVTLDPGDGASWGALVRVQVQAGRGAAAAATMARARAAGWRGPAADVHEALAWAAAGRRDDARRRLASLPESALAADPLIAEVANETGKLLGAHAGPPR